jgi:hypothetical protein
MTAGIKIADLGGCQKSRVSDESSGREGEYASRASRRSAMIW